MQFHDFVGDVQQRTESTLGESVRITRAALQTLGERIEAGEAADLAAPLPTEVDWYLEGAPGGHGERFGWETFVDRMAKRAEADGSDPPSPPGPSSPSSARRSPRENSTTCGGASPRSTTRCSTSSAPVTRRSSEVRAVGASDGFAGAKTPSLAPGGRLESRERNILLGFGNCDSGIIK